MVPRSIRATLQYNEQKAGQGKASCLLASGFLKEAKDLSFDEKLYRMEQLIRLNKRAATNTVHISLNFAEGEKLGEEKLKEIASLYMEKIGFGNQPFLVYEHRDAGHPHLHIVTTNIQRDGRRISLHNLGKNASEKARKELEVQFGLTRAGKGEKQINLKEQDLWTQRAVYGKSPTKQAITNVLLAVLPNYKYASLPELNAILKQYGVMADRGAENGLIYKTGGLLYHILDGQGKKAGVPIKASALPGKPTLRYLEGKFRQNAPQKELYKKRLQSLLAWVIIKPPPSLEAFAKALQTENVSLVKRQNEEGFVYGLTYIDQRTKCVFNGSDLGKAYSAKGILEKCGIKQAPLAEKRANIPGAQRPSVAPAPHAKGRWNEEAALALLAQLMKAEQVGETIPFEWRKQKRKRRKQ